MLKSKILEDLIKSSMKTIRLIYIFKIILFGLILLSYYFKPEWVEILLIITLFFIILFPMNFYGAFIENLVEYNTQALEERIIKNAQETNEYFIKNDEFKKTVNSKIKYIQKVLKENQND